MADQSRARLFFDEIVSKQAGAFGFLCSLIDGGDDAAENGWRDYKEAGFIGRSGHEQEDREKIKKTWSENLSAFANTGGGVLIWGMRTKDKIPDKLSLAPDAQELANLLNTLIIDATDPYVAGVEIRALSEPRDPKPGFVVCYIPASTFPPHQAQWGERTYFIRAQDSNLPCPQPLLRNLFYPRSICRLEPNVLMTVHTERSGAIMVVLEVSILSLGPATAEVAMIVVEPGGLGDGTVSHDHKWEEIGSNILMSKYPLPPNIVCPYRIRIRGILLASGASAVFRFFTHNTPAHISKVSFTQQEILQCLRDQQTVSRRGRSEPVFQ